MGRGNWKSSSCQKSFRHRVHRDSAEIADNNWECGGWTGARKNAKA
jgi:hypothetical protein